MEIKDLILKYLKKRRIVKIADIAGKTGFSRAYIHRFFKELRDDGKILLMGRTNQAHYVLASDKKILGTRPLSFRRTLINRDLSEDLVLAELKRETGILDDLKKNVRDILDYAFTEMLNNAIEHSRSKKVLVQMERNFGVVKFKVIDWGVGVFEDIKRKFKLRNAFEAIELLLKGKQTTASKAHTGEGIFFTSKVADKLIFKSSGKELIFDNRIDDIFVRETKKKKGTEVILEISLDSKRKISAIFREYSNENFVFDKTRVTVKLFELAERSYVSRSQARRLLFGLEKFSRVILDFKKVEAIGQAFADEVFRVWQGKYQKIKIEHINCNKNVEFMIKRVLATCEVV